jgi:general secretion pathway protein D
VSKRLMRPAAAILLLIFVTSSVAADKAKELLKKGKNAEARQNYEEAYDYYKQAYDLKPTDLTYRASYERLKFLAAASHVHRGQLLRDAGKLEDALAEFKTATEIDPSSFVAQQEMQRTQKMIDVVKAGGPKAEVPPSTPMLERQLTEAQGPVQMAPISNVPITLKVTEDTKVIYETVGKLAGINVLFDPDYTSRRIRIELNGVTLEDALQIIALESKTFWRPVTPNTIFIATDSQAKRKDLEQSVIKTFYMANLSQTTELQDVVNTLRQILEISRIQPLPSQNALVVRGTPDQIALAEKLVGDLDKSRPEVVVDIAIMQVSRDKMRTLGVNPPTSATVALQNNVSTTTASGSGGNSASVTQGTPNQVNLNVLGNLNATDFTVTIPPATVTALLSDSNTKLIQNPQIRALDGQKASLKIGDRVPIATGSFQPGIGGVGINPLVNTQFQYLDVGVNIDVTPHVHVGREVSLKITLDVSAVTSTTNIGGINQPVIGQRKIEHDIRLREGEVNIMGGILEDQNTKSLSGIPGLAEIPILKWLFSQTSTEHKENEIVFVLVPHIVRLPDVNDFNQRELEVGTGSTIELRHVSKPITTGQNQPSAGTVPVVSSAPAALAVAGNVPGNGVPGNGAQVVPAPVPGNPAESAATTAQVGAGPGETAAFHLDPGTVLQKVGSTFTVNLLLSGAQNVYSVPLQVSYDPKILQVVNVSNGSLLSQDGQAVALVHREDESTGTMQITATRPPGTGGVSGQGPVVTMTFAAKAPGQSTITVARGGARDPSMQAIPVNGAVATVTITP